MSVEETRSSESAKPDASGALTGTGGPSADSDQSQSELDQFFHQMLELQCRLVGGIAAVVVLAPGQARRGGIAVVHVQDEQRANLSQSILQHLERLGCDIITNATQERAGDRSLVHPGSRIERIETEGGSGLYGQQPAMIAMGCALETQDTVEGAVIVLVPMVKGQPSSIGSGSSTQAIQTIALISARFEGYLWQQQCLKMGEQRARLRETLELLDAAQRGEDAAAMGSLLCHELQRRFGSSRVSIGLLRRDRVRLVSVSGSENIDPNAEAVESIEDAMEECASQDTEILFPVPVEHDHDPALRRVTRAHAKLSSRFGPAAMVSLPLRVDGDLVGVVLLERDATDPFPEGALPLLRLMAEFIGPAMWTRRLADRGVLRVMRDRTIELGQKLVGPRHTGAKLIALTVLIVFVLLVFVPLPARVKASVDLRARTSRTIVPPYAGYLEQVLVRPGDEVHKGQVLAKMVDRELKLSMLELEAKISSLMVQQDEAQRKNELANVRKAQALINEATANLALVQDRFERASIVSPIDGHVARGDLESFIGASVDPTRPLMEIIDDQVIAVVHVDERDASRVLVDSQGAISVKARPGQRVPIVISRVNPVAQVVDGENVYLVEAIILEPVSWLAPGMTGSAKIRAKGWTTGLARIFRPIVDEVRLNMWW